MTDDGSPDETSRHRRKWGLRVPPTVQRVYREEITEQYGHYRPYAAVELERLVRTFLDEGVLADLEDRVDALLAAAPPVPADEDGAKKIPDGGDGGDSVRPPDEAGEPLNLRVDEDLRHQFVSKTDTDSRPAGRILATLMLRFVDGGPEQRIHEKVDRLADRIEATADTVDQDDDRQGDRSDHADDGDDLGLKERRTRAIATELDFPFTRDDFGRALTAADASVSDTDYCRDEYLEPVLDHVNAALNPAADTEEFIPRAEAERLLEDPTEADLRPPDLLSTEQRVNALCRKVCEEGTRTMGKKHRLTLAEVRALPLFNGRGSVDGARDLMAQAGRRSGVKYSPDPDRGPECIVVDSTEYQEPPDDVSPADTTSEPAEQAVADGGWSIDAAAEYIREEHPGKRNPGLLEAVLAKEADREVAPEDVPDDIFVELERRLVSDDLDRHSRAISEQSDEGDLR